MNQKFLTGFKKQISIILILSFFLSLIPNFLYTESRVLAGCPTDCTEEERDGEIYCINCPISCSWETETFINKSCLPSEETGEWTCGIEIPIGEVMDRTTYLASRMLAEFGGIVKGGEEMVIWSDRLLTDYKEWDCSSSTNWEGKETKCETECDKRYQITAGILQSAQSDLECEPETSLGKGIYPKDCNEDHNQCIPCAEYCAREEHKEECCWIDNSQPNPNYDPEHPEIEKEYLSCKYCKKEDEDGTKYCYEYCFVWTCRGCCYQYFNPIINGYTGMEELQKALKNDIEEKTPAGEDLPDNFKLKRSYVLKQLDFARCELARCWISAEDYYDVLSGEKVGKHLLTCEQVTEMGLFDDDQFFCFVAQVEDEWNTITEVWTEPKEHWWQWLVVPFETIFYVQLLPWRVIWHMIKEWVDFGREEGCYQTNYYCCQM